MNLGHLGSRCHCRVGSIGGAFKIKRMKHKGEKKRNIWGKPWDWEAGLVIPVEGEEGGRIG